MNVVETGEGQLMHPDLELLLKLQHVDYDIGELERSKEYMPDMMGSLKNEIDVSSKAIEDARLELEDLTVKQKTFELEVASLQEDLKRYQSQMLSIKTNKEYDALVTEIDAIKTRVSERETEILAAEERIEELNNSQEALESNAKTIAENNGKQLVKLQERIDSVADKIAEQQHERQRIVALVGKPSLSIYERVRRGKGASVVVSLKKRACGGCFKSVPPQRYYEIRKGEKVVCCDNCGRLLVFDQSDQAEQAGE